MQGSLLEGDESMCNCAYANSEKLSFAREQKRQVVLRVKHETDRNTVRSVLLIIWEGYREALREAKGELSCKRGCYDDWQRESEIADKVIYGMREEVTDSDHNGGVNNPLFNWDYRQNFP